MAYDPNKPISTANNPEGISNGIATTPTGVQVDLTTGQQITGASLAPVSTPQTQTPVPTSFTNAGSVPGEPAPIVVPENPQAGTVQSLIDQLTQENTTLAGEGAFRTEQTKAQGIESLTKNQDDLLAQLNLLKANEVNIPLQLQNESIGRGRTIAGAAPIETARLRENAINANIIGAQLAGIQGKIGTALKLVDAAVAAKFDAIKADREAKIANLQLIMSSPQYTEAEKLRANAQLRIQNREAAKEEQQRKDFEEAQKEVLKYPEANAQVRAEMSKAKNAVEVQGIAQRYGLKTNAEKQAEANIASTNALAGQRSGTDNSPISGADFDRYVAAYPDAHIAPGDSAGDVKAKIAVSQDPEASVFWKANPGLTLQQIQQIQAARQSGNTGTPAPAATTPTPATPPTNPIFGKGNFAKIDIQARYNQLKKANYPGGASYIREQMYKDGYPLPEIEKLTGNLINKIFGY